MKQSCKKKPRDLIATSSSWESRDERGMRRSGAIAILCAAAALCFYEPELVEEEDVIILDENVFDKFLQQAKPFSLVQFHAPW